MSATIPVEQVPPGWGFRNAINIAPPTPRHPDCQPIVDALAKGPLRMSTLVYAAKITEARARNAMRELIEAEEVVAVWTTGIGKGRAHWVYQLPGRG